MGVGGVLKEYLGSAFGVVGNASSALADLASLKQTLPVHILHY